MSCERDTSHGRSLLVRVVLYQQHYIKYVPMPLRWDPPWCGEPGCVCRKQVKRSQAPMGDGLGAWGCQEKQSLERKVGSQSSVGFSSGCTPSCRTCSPDDSQGWVTLDNKTGTPKGLRWFLEALLIIVFLADVVRWQKTPPHSCIYGILEMQTAVFYCRPCWYPTLLGCSWLWSGVIFPFDFLELFFFFWTKAGSKFQRCQGKGYLWDWQRPCQMNFSEPFWWNLIKHSDQHCANLPVFASYVIWLTEAGLSGGGYDLWYLLGWMWFHTLQALWSFPRCLQVSVGFSWISYAVDVSSWGLREHIDDIANLSDKDMSCTLMHFSCPSDSTSVLVSDRTLASC